MQLYQNSDLVGIEDNLSGLLDKIDEKKLQILEPTKKQLLEFNKIILTFIKENKRKIYGGYAQNKLVSTKNPEDAFYKENSVADIDFYSPDPMGDLIKLADLFYQLGYNYVQGKEALHKETYSLFVEFNKC